MAKNPYLGDNLGTVSKKIKPHNQKLQRFTRSPVRPGQIKRVCTQKIKKCVYKNVATLIDPENLRKLVVQE